MWAACVIVIWTVFSMASQTTDEASAVLQQAAQNVFWLLVAALVGLTVTGAARLFYWRSDTPAEQRADKRVALVVKHVVFIVVYGLGTVWAAQMAF